MNVTVHSGSERLIWSHIPPSLQCPLGCVSVTAMCGCVGLRLAMFLFTVPLQRGRSDCVLSGHVPNIMVRGSCFRRRHVNPASFGCERACGVCAVARQSPKLHTDAETEVWCCDKLRLITASGSRRCCLSRSSHFQRSGLTSPLVFQLTAVFPF